jgi:hypothetical protein
MAAPTLPHIRPRTRAPLRRRTYTHDALLGMEDEGFELDEAGHL